MPNALEPPRKCRFCKNAEVEVIGDLKIFVSPNIYLKPIIVRKTWHNILIVTNEYHDENFEYICFPMPADSFVGRFHSTFIDKVRRQVLFSLLIEWWIRKMNPNWYTTTIIVEVYFQHLLIFSNMKKRPLQLFCIIYQPIVLWNGIIRNEII